MKIINRIRNAIFYAILFIFYVLCNIVVFFTGRGEDN